LGEGGASEEGEEGVELCDEHDADADEVGLKDVVGKMLLLRTRGK
jgi:hypothetical protein